MAVKIRLKRMGKIRAPYYRIVVADSRTKRDGRVIEEIGKYHPKQDPSFIEVDSDRVQYWLGVGAQPTEPVTAILRVTGDWQKFHGEPAPAPMLVAEPRRDKAALFNEALKDSHGEPAEEAVTPRRATKRAQPAAEKPAAAEPAEAGSAESESAESESAETESAETGSAETESAETGSAETESAETESAETESAETGSADAESQQNAASADKAEDQES